MEHSLWQYFVGHRPALLVNVAKVLAAVGDETVLLPLAVILAVCGAVSRKRLLSLLAPLAALAPTIVVVGILKSLINRSRPPAVSALVEVTSASMPSGHAAYAAALAAAAWLLVAGSPRQSLWRTCSVVVAIAAGVSRMVLGVHWAGDVLAGWAVGATVGFCVVSALGKRLQSNR